ncbi:SAV_2336 N-terminal domain-related protein [Streptomyces sp. NPDC005485]|uniref:SAV_2336 N-terminal domain-related protein n=1 Tax=Streptomyces sp. NPDC005485 TaxID=3155591 RepID=UPI0033AD58B6
MSAPAPRSAPSGGASAQLAALVARMREADIPPSVEELADALWLARWLPAPQRPFSPAPPAHAGPRPPAGGADGSHSANPTGPYETVGETQPPSRAGLFAPGPGDEGTADAEMRPVRVPAAPALPEPLALQRGLRPLQRYRAPVRPIPRVLDENATAERAAESGLLLPVLRTERRREARLLLLMDVSTSTIVWQQALDELRQVCERAGAFREVHVQYLHEAEGGQPGCAATPERTGPLHAPEQLCDPTGRRLTLVLSDCAGPMWRGGRMQRLLHRWASTAPVAVVQPLPQRMWLRTHLPARRGLLHRREGPAGQLEFTPDRGRPERGALPIPVLALRRGSVEGWARLVAGSTGQSLSTAAGWVRADHPASSAPVRAAEDISGEERVRVFWRPASQEARRLAVYLSAVPLYLPVMQLVQHAMLAGSGPEVLSEVLLSGLLKRREDASDPRAVRYDFLPGVARELRAQLALHEVELLFKHCSEYVERRFGRSARNFPAMAGAFLRGAVDPAAAGTADEGEGPAGLRAFAEVSADVLRDLGQRVPAPSLPPMDFAELIAKGRAALARYEAEGLTRELDAAIGHFEGALAQSAGEERRAAAAEELAFALLTRWRVRRVGEDLRDALEAVGGEPGGGPRTQVMRGLIYWTLARELPVLGADFDGIPQGVHDWVRDQDSAHPREKWTLVELLYCADLLLSQALFGLREIEPPSWRLLAAEALPAVRRAFAEQAAHLASPHGDPTLRADSPEEWYVRGLHRAIESVKPLLDFPPTERGRLVCGRLWLDLARQYAGQGLVEATAARNLAVGAAQTAVDNLMVAVRPEDVLPAPERCRAWLDVASALEIAQPPREDGRERRMILGAVDQAMAAAGEDSALRYECHVWAARTYRARYDGTARGADLDSSIAAWKEALLLLDQDDPRTAGALKEYGTTLLQKGMDQVSVEDIEQAVRTLRAAVDETAETDPALPSRRMQLGTAYLARYETTEVLSDLYEADWIFGEAARTTDAPGEAAQAWFFQASLAQMLAARTGMTSHLHRAAKHFRNAVDSALENGEPGIAASAHESRGGVFERLGEVHQAEAAYREALRLTTHTDQATRLRARIDDLGTPPGETAQA